MTGAARWPIARAISPSLLRAYRRCPFQVRLAQIDRVTPPFRYNAALSKGRIAHVILKRVADTLARGGPPIDEAEMLRMARLHLPRQAFPTPGAHEQQARQIVRWAMTGRRYLERHPDARYLMVERPMTRRWRIVPGHPPYTIAARPDVVLLRADEDGGALVEIVDYKTGRVPPEPPVLTRFVARDVLARHPGDRVRFTYLWLDADDETRIELTTGHCYAHWDGIVGTLHDLASETAWAPRPSVLCRSCPFYRSVCTAGIPAG